MTAMARAGEMQPYSLTLDRFIDHAAKWHGHTKVVTGNGHGATRIGYAGLRERSQRLSGALRFLGLSEGDNLGVLAWNSQTHLETWYGALGIGVVCHTLNPRLSAEHLATIVGQAGNRVLVISADLSALAEKLVPLCPTLRHIVVLEETGFDAVLPQCADVDVWQYETLLAAHGEATPWGSVDERAPAGLCFTSGTTGAPKGVTYTHRSSYLHTVHQLQADVTGLTARDTLLVAVPMFHANGWGFAFSAPAAGAKLVFAGRYLDGANLYRLINAEGVTAAAGVPTIWLGLCDYLEETGFEVPSLERIMLGGSAVPQALMDRFEARLGCVVQTSWGMTELSPLGTMAPLTTPRRSAAKSGRPPVGVDLLLTDTAGAPLSEQRDVEGHLRVRGASVIQRYFGHEAPAVDAAGWFDTGDLAVIDGDGQVKITGRAKDLIKSGGEWINPGEIEAIVGEFPEVALAAVVARAHPKWGERPVLIVEMRKGAQLADERLVAALRARVASWWLPDAIIRLAEMPLALTGKIDKSRLRADFGQAP